MMAEGGNVRYAIKLAQRIKAPFHRFVALAEIAFTHYMETNNNPDKALLISLLDQAGALLPEIMEKHKGRYELASNQHTLIYLYNALDMCDKAIEELDRILILEDKISELSLFLNNLHHANKRSELQELIRRYCHFSQSLNIVDKAKWICALVQEIERYGKFVDSRQLVATLHDEINREEDVICRYNAMIHLGVCYLRINDGETAFTAFRSLEIENTTDITEDHRIRIFVDLLVALANERLVAAVVRALELSDDPRLLVHTFLKIPDRIENHYRDEIACNVPESRENYRKMLEKIHQAVASLENPLDRALALTCLIASNNEAR